MRSAAQVSSIYGCVALFSLNITFDILSQLMWSHVAGHPPSHSNVQYSPLPWPVPPTHHTTQKTNDLDRAGNSEGRGSIEHCGRGGGVAGRATKGIYNRKVLGSIPPLSVFCGGVCPEARTHLAAVAYLNNHIVRDIENVFVNSCPVV